MGTPTVHDPADEPRVYRSGSEGGRWVAVSPPNAAIGIGVVADSETEARTAYALRLAWWRAARRSRPN